jgi:ligand-binding sensor domain-containing protein
MVLDRKNIPMQRWIFILTASVALLAACSPNLPSIPPPPATNTPPGLSQQLYQFATQTQAAAMTAIADALQATPQGQLPAYTPSPKVSLPLPLETAGPFQQVSQEEALIAGKVLDLQVDENRILLISENGVSEYKDGMWSGFFTGEYGYPVGIDAVGGVWIAHPDGSVIFRSEPEIWLSQQSPEDIVIQPVPFRQEEGWEPVSSALGNPVNYGLLTDNQGDLWLTTRNDVRSFNDTWTVYDSQTMGMPEPASDTNPQFTILPLSNTDEVLVGRCDWGSTGAQGGGGMRTFDGQAWMEIAEALNSGCVTAIVESPGGDLWLALDNSLYHLDPAAGDWEQISLPEAPPQTRFGYVSSLTADPNAGIWSQLAVCSTEGCFGGEMLYRFQNSTWQPIGAPSPAGGQRILFDALGTPWLLSAGSVSQILDGAIQPIPALVVLAATNDAAGKLWLVAQSSGLPTVWTER